MSHSFKRIVQPGLRAARANLLPGLCLQALALMLVLGYYFSATICALLQEIAELKTQHGYYFAMFSTSLFGGLIPACIHYLFKERKPAQLLKLLWFYLLFWALKGAEVNLFYQLQAVMFGDRAALSTIVMKVAIDQLLYVPFWAVPTMALGYLWKEARFSFKATRNRIDRNWYANVVLPMLLANWGVWIPTVAMIYCLPLPLQLPLQNLVLCLWSLLLILIVRPDTPASGCNQMTDRAEAASVSSRCVRTSPNC